MKVLWDKLENYHPIPHCTRSIGCSCGAIESIKIYREQDYVIRFLKGLNYRFSHTKSQTILSTLLPNVDTIFSMLIQQEREISNSTTDSIVHDTPDTDSATALLENSRYGKGRGQGYRGEVINRLCTHCNRTNHTVKLIILYTLITATNCHHI